MRKNERPVESTGHDHEHEQQWRAVLMGEARGLKVTRRLVGWIPVGPRCKLCLAPLRPPGSLTLKLVGFGPSRLNRRLCRACFRAVERSPGGAEIELLFMLARSGYSASLNWQSWSSTSTPSASAWPEIHSSRPVKV
jgi:hypothetical protein